MGGCGEDRDVDQREKKVVKSMPLKLNSFQAWELSPRFLPYPRSRLCLDEGGSGSVLGRVCGSDLKGVSRG